VRTTQAGQSFLLLLDVIDVLKAKHIDYAVIGAVAASVHGVIRASLDADALLSMTVRSLEALEKDLKPHFHTILRRGSFEDPIAAVLVVKDIYENRVDLLVGIKGFDDRAFSRTIKVPFGNEHLAVVAVEDFIAMKIYAGSPQDLSDARRALEISSVTLDRPLLESITARYGKKYLKTLKTLF
jgi:hypothetical protein